MAGLDVFQSDCDRGFPQFRTLLHWCSVGFRRFIRHCGLMNHSKQRTLWILPSALLPRLPAHLSTLTHSQSLLPTECKWEPHTHPLGTREIRSSVDLSLAPASIPGLCVFSRLQVFSQTLFLHLWSGNKPAHHMLGKLTATGGAKLCDAYHPGGFRSCLLPFFPFSFLRLLFGFGLCLF